MTQKEFDTQMTEWNNQQYAEKQVLELQKQEHNNQMARIRTEIARLYAEIDIHRNEVHKLNLQIKDINVKYHNLKMTFIQAHPIETQQGDDRL